MGKVKFTLSVEIDHTSVMRRLTREATVADMREGRVLKAHTFRSKKGKGSYRRNTKHKEF